MCELAECWEYHTASVAGLPHSAAEYCRQDNSGYCLWNGVAATEHVAALFQDQYCSQLPGACNGLER